MPSVPRLTCTPVSGGPRLPDTEECNIVLFLQLALSGASWCYFHLVAESANEPLKAPRSAKHRLHWLDTASC
eukprot:9511269-Alexandrium_andersonii.AAC.1